MRRHSSIKRRLTSRRRKTSRRSSTRRQKAGKPDELMSLLKNNPEALKKLQILKKKDPSAYNKNKGKAVCLLKCKNSKDLKAMLKCMKPCATM